MNLTETHASFNGEQQIWQHNSKVLNCSMNVAVYLPPQVTNLSNSKKCAVVYWLSGLTCTERNFIEKSGFQRYASELGLIIVAPDTSPRGEDVANDDGYDLGQGAGFYVNATQDPWAKHYQMYDYIVEELPQLINDNFNTNGKQSIMGHSMGGHGALMIALRNPQNYQSVSAFAPIVAPMQAAWGQKAFTAYLGNNKTTWAKYDTVELLKNSKTAMPMLIEQGMNDEFLSQLQPQLLTQITKEKNIEIILNEREGYDHSYYFIASFIGEHLAYHAQALNQTLS
ncbi:MAG: S-formylglutathione hydrolase [Moraxellaceae bacterium]|nr:S-formylglutathione hydrolase [Moraxellaceae bacterium]